MHARLILIVYIQISNSIYACFILFTTGQVDNHGGRISCGDEHQTYCFCDATVTRFTFLS